MIKRKVAKAKKLNFTSSNEKWPSKSILLYGPPGSGKTHFIGTISQDESMQKVLVLDNDGGTLTLSSNPNFKDIAIVRMYEYEPYVDFINWLRGNSNVPAVKEWQDNLGDPSQYKTIAIDNIGKWHKHIMNWILANEQFKRFHKDIPAQTDYRLAIAIIQQILEALSQHALAEGVSIILTAHSHLRTDDTDRVLAREPAISGQLAQSIAGDMPLVGYCEVTNKREAGRPGQVTNKATTPEYAIYFEPFDRYTIVKNQYYKKIGKMIDPSYQKLSKFIN